MWRATVLTVGCLLFAKSSFAETYPLKVFPPESKSIQDPVTGAKLTLVTTDPAKDTVLYFHQRSFTADEGLIFFYSDRKSNGVKSSLWASIAATGETIAVTTPTGNLGCPTAELSRNSVLGLRGRQLVELSLSVKPSKHPKKKPSVVIAEERVIAELPEGDSPSELNENADGTFAAVGGSYPEFKGPGIKLVDLKTGAIRPLCAVPDPPKYQGHVQWSRVNPNLLSFAGLKPRLWVVDIRDGKPRSIYPEQEGELVTHEHWWVQTEHGDDQMVFCGGLHPKPSEDAHVKVINVRTGEVRILAAGCWYEGITDDQAAKNNYWHCSGSDDGHWVVADNWFGDITIIDAHTSRPTVLTTANRVYGEGEHPHVGWDRKSRRVIFSTDRNGNSDICIAELPETPKK